MKVFISHIAEERDIASVLREWICTAFPQNCEVFVSSEMPLGKEWRSEIKKALDSAHIVLVLCSLRSMRRPWVNFEAGCGWIKGLDVVPICHSGQSKSQLPKPISEFQAIDLEDDLFPQTLLNTLAQYDTISRVPTDLFDDLRQKLDDAITKVQERFKLLQGIQIHPEWNNKILLEALDGAPDDSEISVLQTWFPDVEQICPKLEDLLTAKKRFRFKVLLMDKGEANTRNDLLDARVKHRQEERETARRNIEHTTNQLVKMKKRVDAEWEKLGLGELELEIRSYNFMPFGPICQIGNTAMFVGFYTNYASSINAPMVVIGDPKSEVWEKFERNFRVGWDNTKDIQFSWKVKVSGVGIGNDSGTATETSKSSLRGQGNE